VAFVAVAAHRHTTALQLQRRAEGLQETSQRQKAAFLQAAAASLAASAASTAAGAEAAVVRLSAAVSRQLLHDQLEGIHLIKQEQQERVAAQQAAEAAAAAARAAAEDAARIEKCSEQRAQVMTYKQQVRVVCLVSCIHRVQLTVTVFAGHHMC
jgi:hypothetical protein